MPHSLLVVSCAVGWFALGCGETRSLDLFPKKQPMMMPVAVCGSLDKCPADRNLCVEGQCVQCIDDAQCMAPKAGCLDNVCVECLVNDQCPMDKVCHPEVGRCTEQCSDATQCKDKNRAVCHSTRGLCVECTLDVECDDKHVCDERINDCVGCASDGDCADGGVCDTERRECAK
jgi:Cys-rich repeat protein